MHPLDPPPAQAQNLVVRVPPYTSACGITCIGNQPWRNDLQPILCSISEAAKALGLGRSKTYELIAAGRLETVSIGRRRLIRIESVKTFAENLEV
ncbi:excisionase family DNA-binding protein [Emcibacter sp. SYSU 3D8]|uniref:excisionase family DNA-binding protein n=1 Tax=Emcibacter sp. SYSU 3D8 TaxID=3133969 RepID=UPI0031FE5DFC